MSCRQSKKQTRSYPDSREILGARHRKLGVAAHAFGLGDLLRPLDRRLVVVEAVDRRFRVCLRHQHGRDPVPATDIRDLRPSPQLILDALERRDPLADQVGAVPRTEELLGPEKQLRVVLMPAEPFARPEPLGDLLPVLVRGADDVVAAEQVDRAVLVGERHRLLRRKLERIRSRVVFDVTAGSLGRSPLTDVALPDPAALGNLGRRQRPGPRHGLPQPELAAKHHQDAVHRRAHVGHSLAEELLESRLVELTCGSHLGSPFRLSAGRTGCRAARAMLSSRVSPRTPRESIPFGRTRRPGRAVRSASERAEAKAMAADGRRRVRSLGDSGPTRRRRRARPPPCCPIARFTWCGGRVRGVASLRLGRFPSAVPSRAGAARTSGRSGRRAGRRSGRARERKVPR